MASSVPTLKASLDAIDEVVAKLTLVSSRLEDPMPALQDIVAEFSLMERQRFLSYGSAPEFGISQKWTQLASSTIEERAKKGGNPKDQALLDHGPLMNAATNPKIEYFGSKSLRMIVSVKNKKGVDYGVFHQNGNGLGGRGNLPPKREFVTITEDFRLIAKRIMELYILKGVVKGSDKKELDIPSNSPLRSDLRNEYRNYRKRLKRSSAKAESRAVRDPINESKPTKIQSFGQYMHSLGQRERSVAEHELYLKNALHYTNSKSKSLAGTAEEELYKDYIKYNLQYIRGDANMRKI